ncbi:MAG TPA: SpoIIE family protein phosphatase [Mycobacteriales bacterium]|nr:SpoIIE family protein phosphatase [Mycobacteriales bacterium]
MHESGLLDAVDAAVIVTDLRGRLLYRNAAAGQLFGYPPGQPAGQDADDPAAPIEHITDETTLSLVLSGQRWSGQRAIRCADGTSREFRLTDAPHWHRGAVIGVVRVAVDARDPTAIAAAAAVFADRLDRLSRVIAELAGARSIDDVSKIVVAHAAAALGASVASLSLLDEDAAALVLVGISGAQAETARRWESHPVAAQVPAGEAVRTKAPVLISGTAAIEARYPLVAGQLPDERSLVCLPLLSGDRALGAIALIFLGPRLPDERERAFLTTLADACAQALERIQAQRDASERAAKLEFLAQASIELASSLDYRTTLASVARLAVPTLADWCAVEIVEDGRLHTVAVAHVDAAKVALAEKLQRQYPTDPASPTGAPNVLRTGESELYGLITDEMLVAGARDADHLRLMRTLQLRSAVVVPLLTGTRVLGTLTMLAAESGRRYGPKDVAFAEDVGRRAAVAIDNSQLHTETRDAALRLQQAVVPSVLPHIAGFELATEYHPAGRTDVGGDLYDAIALEDGRVVIVVGDVMGRGVRAAAAMAQMRAAIRAYVAIDPDPVVVMTHLDRMFTSNDIAQLVTLLYILADRDHLAIVNAGHPPAVLVPAEGPPQLLPFADSVPLGAGPDIRTSTHRLLPPGTTLLVYTDGLIERRGEDITTGLDRLLAHGSLLRDAHLSTGLRSLVEVLHDSDRDDDVTAMVVRRRPDPSRP